MTMPLDLTPLAKATARLREGLARYLSDPTDTQIRDGLIQRFEFTYELSHKMLRRHLEQVAATPGEYDGADFHYLIRSGNEQGLLLSAWPVWRRFRELRGKTSHTYDEDIALEVVGQIPAFLIEAEHLLQSLQQRQVP
jgi:nucleotidyltransferase substrate binding protein (TIGR01987 family)